MVKLFLEFDEERLELGEYETEDEALSRLVLWDNLLKSLQEGKELPISLDSEILPFLKRISRKYRLYIS